MRDLVHAGCARLGGKRRPGHSAWPVSMRNVQHAVCAARALACAMAQTQSPNMISGQRYVTLNLKCICKSAHRSGSGKSTLLEVLAGRKGVGTLGGHIGLAPPAGTAPALALTCGTGALSASPDGPAQGVVTPADGLPMAQTLQLVTLPGGAGRAGGGAEAAAPTGPRDAATPTLSISPWAAEPAGPPQGPDLCHGATLPGAGSQVGLGLHPSLPLASSPSASSSPSAGLHSSGPGITPLGSPEQQWATAAGQGLVWRPAGGAHRAEMLARSAFVPQEDAFPAQLTAGEVLLLWAGLLGVGSTPAAAVSAHGGVSPAGAGKQQGADGANVRKGRHGARREAVARALAVMGLSGKENTLVGPGGSWVTGASAWRSHGACMGGAGSGGLSQRTTPACHVPNWAKVMHSPMLIPSPPTSSQHLSTNPHR